MLADVVDAPVYAGLGFDGQWPGVVHVTGCEIATGQAYDVQSIVYGQDIGDEAAYSDPCTLHTPQKWGDVVSICPSDECLPPQGIANLDDIMAGIRKFQGTNVAPFTWLDIDPSDGDGLPNQIINLQDILSSVRGFQGDAYPGLGPLGCP
jgi:hypothetical protein